MSIAGFVVGRVYPSAQRSERTCAAALVTQSLAAQCYASQSCVFTLADMREVAEAAATRQNYCPLDQHPEASQ
jgi:hypothetical protein